MAQYRVDQHEYLPNGKTLFEVVMLADQYGNRISGSGNPTGMAVDAFGRARISQPFTLFDDSNRYAISESFVTANTGGDISYDANTSMVSLNVDDQAGSIVQRETKRVFAYQPGKSLQILNTFVFDPNTPKAGLSQRVGYFTDFNGIYFENNGVTNQFVLRSISDNGDTTVTQANWNIDKLDGTGPSKLTLDVTKAQIFFIDIEWLGVGTVRCGFVINGQLIHCHSFHHANIIDSTYMTTATLPIRYEIENTANTASPSSLKQICSSVVSEGGYELNGTSRTIGLEPTGQRTLTLAGTYYPVVSIRLNPDRLNDVVVIRDLAIMPISSAFYKLKIVRDATITGAVWSNVASSCVQYNSNNAATMTGGTDLFSDYFNSTNQSGTGINIPSDIFKFQLERNGLTDQPITLTMAVTASVATSNVVAAIDFEEVT